MVNDKLDAQLEDWGNGKDEITQTESGTAKCKLKTPSNAASQVESLLRNAEPVSIGILPALKPPF